MHRYIIISISVTCSSATASLALFLASTPALQRYAQRII